MSLSIRISDQAGGVLARIRDAAQAERLVLVGARAVAVGVREHLLGLQQERHRPGKGDSFYGRAARSVSANRAVGASAVVAVAQRGVRLRRLGGVVRPGPGKRLVAYPADDAPREAFEFGPSYFADLEIARRINPKHGGLQLCLIRRPSTAVRFVRRKKKDGTITTRVKAEALRGGEIVFWLARKTTHRADPTVLPDGSVMERTAVEGMGAHLLTIKSQKALPSS